MAQYANPSFEEEGATVGSAFGWALSSVATAEELAGFDSDVEPVEDFEEGWLNDSYTFEFSQDALVPGDFEGDPALGPTPEQFETTWLVEGDPSAGPYLFHLESTGAALFVGNVEHEAFVARHVTDGSTNIGGTQLTSIQAAFTAVDIGRYVIADGQPVATITGVAGNIATISPSWTGSSLFVFDVSEWDHRLPAF